MRIGSLSLPSGAGLAPMAGVTDMPFRVLCGEQGASWAVTEMLSAKGYLYAPAARQVGELLARDAREGVLGIQLFGHEPDIMAEAAARLSPGFDFVDINMGCPAHKIVSGGDGSALMKRPELAGKIVRAVVDRVKCPVTVKLRAGWDERHANGVELCRIARDAGASAITLHARTREQFYAGKADWEVIARAVEAVDIPVVGNGDVTGGREALDMLEKTGCAGVMVGRAAQGNPWIFREIACALAGEPWEAPSFADRVRMALRHLQMEMDLRGERSAVLEMRKHVAWYLSGHAGCAKTRARINMLESADDVRAALEELL